MTNCVARGRAAKLDAKPLTTVTVISNHACGDWIIAVAGSSPTNAVSRVLPSGDPNGIDFGQGPPPFGQSRCDRRSRFARLELKFSSCYRFALAAASATLTGFERVWPEPMNTSRLFKLPAKNRDGELFLLCDHDSSERDEIHSTFSSGPEQLWLVKPEGRTAVAATTQ